MKRVKIRVGLTAVKKKHKSTVDLEAKIELARRQIEHELETGKLWTRFEGELKLAYFIAIAGIGDKSIFADRHHDLKGSIDDLIRKCNKKFSEDRQKSAKPGIENESESDSEYWQARYEKAAQSLHAAFAKLRAQNSELLALRQLHRPTLLSFPSPKTALPPNDNDG